MPQTARDGRRMAAEMPRQAVLSLFAFSRYSRMISYELDMIAVDDPKSLCVVRRRQWKKTGTERQGGCVYRGI